ncbi:MAG: hypothetical protein RBR97_20870 [Bacteroidales bacterium]|nr:hypothetical protein [Bacteroidales bacterium]
MTYAMTLDNLWELMSEEEMYDVNGGAVYISNSTLVGMFSWLTSFSVTTIVAYATVIKTTLAAFVTGLSLGTAVAIAAFIIGTDTLGLAIELSSALTSGLGLEISLNYKKFLGVSIPIGLQWEAK